MFCLKDAVLYDTVNGILTLVFKGKSSNLPSSDHLSMSIVF